MHLSVSAKLNGLLFLFDYDNVFFLFITIEAIFLQLDQEHSQCRKVASESQRPRIVPRL